MNRLYPNTGNLLIKSGTAINHLERAAGDQGKFENMLKSLAAEVQKEPAAVVHSPSQVSPYGVSAEQIHQRRLAEVEMRKCMSLMKAQGMAAADIVQFQQATEAALNNPAINNDLMVKALTQLRDS